MPRADAETAEELLGDFAPALRLLPAPERQRALALATYAGALFDRARSGDGRQDGANRKARVESIDRLAGELGRRLEAPVDLQTLPEAGPAERPPRPVLAMAAAHRRRPWPPEALAEIATTARRRAVTPRPETRREGFASAMRLGAALACAQLGAPQPPEVARFAGALLRLALIQRLGAEIEAGRCCLALEDLGDDVTGGAAKADLREIVRAVRGQCQRMRPDLLAIGKAFADLPDSYRQPLAYLLLASLRLLAELEDADSPFLVQPPTLGRLTRLRLLMRARRGGVASLAG
jgi:hypothetical protein